MTYKKNLCTLFCTLFCIFLYSTSWTTELNHTGKALPRFATLKSSKVNLRSGPSKTYPILWTYTKQHYPILIIAEYDHWRKIEDHEGTKGWVHKALLASKHKIITLPAGAENNLIPIFKSPNMNSPRLGYTEFYASGEIKTCKENYCLIIFKNLTGWIRKESLWGTF